LCLVVGCLKENTRIDRELILKIKELSDNKILTFHRAFDLIQDKFQAIDQLSELGFTRILTSGGCPSAWEGRFKIKELIEYANGRIEIMPGCGINLTNIVEIISITKASAVHTSAKLTIGNHEKFLFPNHVETNLQIVKKLKEILIQNFKN
jgi:copper homeostasis protein